MLVLSGHSSTLALSRQSYIDGMKRERWVARWAATAVEWIEDVTVFRTDGSRVVETAPCIWTRLHRGSSTQGHVNVFLHSSREEALAAAVDFAIDVLGGGSNRDIADQLYEAGRYDELLDLYERTHVSGDAILRVEWGLPVGDMSGVDGLRREESASGDRAERRLR